MTGNWTPIEFAAINAVCQAQGRALLAHWLPSGQQWGREWVALNPTRGDKSRGSFRVNMDTGKWADFATGDRGGDLVSLYAYLNRLSQGQAARELAQHLGVAT